MTTEISTIPKGMEDMMTLDRPAGADEGTLGNESIGKNDIAMPRIGLAQKTSHEIDPTDAKYITGLAFMDLFHSSKKLNLGKGPLHFVILRRDEPRWIEYNPLEEGGGIRDMDVQRGDPRTKFVDGENPIATEYHDFIVLLLTGIDLSDPLDSIAAISLKSSGIKAAKHLNFLITLRGPKQICKGVYALTTGYDTDKKSGATYAIYKFANAGWLKSDSQIEKLAVELFDTWKDRTVEFEREPEGDPTDFPHGENAQTEM